MRENALAAWHGLLAEVGHHGNALCSAIAGDDVIGAIAATMQLRRSRSSIARLEGPSRLRGSTDELALLDEVAALTIGARAAETAMERWRTRDLPDDRQLLSSALGIAILADAMLPPVWDFEADLVVLAGTGLEPVAQLLLDLGQQRIVIVGSDEPAPPGALDVRDATELVRAMRTMVPGAPTQAVIRGAPGSDPAAIAALSEDVRGAISDLRIHRNTICAFSRTWLSQALTNLPALGRWPSVDAVGDRFAGVPMIIVAPGPSLAKNIDQLRALQGRAIITCFSHSLKPVLAAGIVPDLIVTVDPQDVRYHFSGCDVSNSCLVTAATAHPSLFEMPAPRHLALSANSAIDDWIFEGLGEDAVVPGGGSVATTALSLALRWRCDPIVFVGLDLSFPGGNYYVNTSSDGGARAEVDDRGLMRVAGWSSGFHAMKAGGGPAAPAERAIELPGWHGGTVPSSFMFGMFHRWFVDRLSSVTDTTVYNCTEGGAFIRGMTHVPLAEVASTLVEPVGAARMLDEVVAATAPDRAEKLASHFGGHLTALRRCRKLAVRARSLARAGAVGRDLERTEQQLADALRPLVFVSLLAQREVERATDAARRQGTEATYLSESMRLFDAVVQVIDELRPQLEAALGRMDRARHARE